MESSSHSVQHARNLYTNGNDSSSQSLNNYNESVATTTTTTTTTTITTNDTINRNNTDREFITLSTIDSYQNGSGQFVGRQEEWARLSSYHKVQRRLKKNLKIYSFRKYRKAKYDPLPFAANLAGKLLKNKEKGIVSSVIAKRLCEEAKISAGSINVYPKLANLMNKTLEAGRLKLKAIDFVNIFLQYVNQVIPSLSAEVQTMFQTIVNPNLNRNSHNSTIVNVINENANVIHFVKTCKQLFEKVFQSDKIQIQQSIEKDLFNALNDVKLNVTCLTNCNNNPFAELYPNYNNQNIAYEACFDKALQKMWLWQTYQDLFFVRDFSWRKTPYPPRPFEVITEYISAIEPEKCYEMLISSKKGLHAPPEGAPGASKLPLDLKALERREPLILAPKGTNFPNNTCEYDIVLTSTWGYDSSTYRRIFRALLVNSVLTEEVAKKFMAKTLLPAINRQKDADAHDFGIVLHDIIKMSKKKGNHIAFTCAKTILHEVQKDRVFYCSKNFRIYPKGQGLLCNRKEGIKAGTFVERYLGELFSPWRWFEKTDAVKVVQKKLGMKTTLPDFYNIIMERHSDDEKGYNLMFVDPIAKGNIASRLSHSCTPNCATIVVSENGKYVTTVYAVRDIEYGEELSFDYGSFTEDKREHEQATCLCGTGQCRGAFLQYSNDRVFQEVMLKEHTTVDRAAILVRACTEELNDNDRKILKTHKLGSSVTDGAPDWLLKWGALILEFLDFEKKQLTYDLVRRYSFYNLESANDDAVGVHATRVQNLVITLEKLKYFLRQPNQKQNPPLRVLTPKEVVDILWNDTKNKIGEPIVKTIIKNAISGMQNFVIRQKLKKILQTKIKSNAKGLKSLKEDIMIQARDLLYKLPQTNSRRYTAAADLITLYAYTKLNFTMNTYNGFSSPPLKLRQCDVGDTCRALKEKDSVVKGKSYNRQYVWGQLHFWERQTIAQPDASLMAARYGPVVLPDADCCFNTHLNPYSPSQRKSMLEIFEHQPHSQWKTTTHWRFRNKYSLFGTPFIDAAYKKSKEGFDKLLNLTPRIPPSSPVILTESVKANVNGNATISKDSSDSSTTTTTTMNIVSEEEDNVPCNICGLTGDTPENPALLCETCITGCAHIRCLNLKKVPEGDWYCGACNEKRLLAIPKWLREIKSFHPSMIEKIDDTNNKNSAAYAEMLSKKRSASSNGSSAAHSNGSALSSGKSTKIKLKKRKENPTKSEKQTKKKKKKEEKLSSIDDDIPCNICGLTGSTEWNPALLCDGCEYGCAHLECLNLQRVPRKEWFCDLCK